MIATGTGLACPRCGSDKTGVKDSRNCLGGIRRRRYCLTCTEWNRFSTIEIPLGPEVDLADRAPIVRTLELLGTIYKLPSHKRELVLSLVAAFAADEVKT